MLNYLFPTIWESNDKKTFFFISQNTILYFFFFFLQIFLFLHFFSTCLIFCSSSTSFPWFCFLSLLPTLLSPTGQPAVMDPPQGVGGEKPCPAFQSVCGHHLNAPQTPACRVWKYVCQVLLACGFEHCKKNVCRLWLFFFSIWVKLTVYPKYLIILLITQQKCWIL